MPDLKGQKSAGPALCIDINHSNIPQSLGAMNERLRTAFDNVDEDSDERVDELIAIVNERAILVKKLLNHEQQIASNSVSSDKETACIDVRAFAEAEYAINNALENIIKDLKQKVINDIASLNKSRKAIGKYTGQNVKLHKRTPAQR